jgi:outer membrane immunogenic protein
MRKIAIVVIGILGLMGTQARAADMAVKAPLPAPPPVSDWSGVYVGLEGGYGWGKQSTDAINPGDQFPATFTSLIPGITPPSLAGPFFCPDVAILSTKQNGWLAGGFFGAQKQWGRWVLGIEGDIDAANMKGSGSSAASSAINTLTVLLPPPGPGLPSIPFPLVCPGGPCLTLNHNLSIDSKIDMLASLRGKVGWSVAPDWLIYGTGGAAFAHVENTVASTESAAVNPVLLQPLFGPFLFTPGSTPRPLNASGGATMFGWAAGAGVDWKLPLDAGSALVFGVEYLHYGFPEQTITVSNNAGGSVAFRATEHVDAVKGRISYLFSVH